MHLATRQQAQLNSNHVIVHSGCHAFHPSLKTLMIIAFLQNQFSEDRLNSGLDGCDILRDNVAPVAELFLFVCIHVDKFLNVFHIFSPREDCLPSEELASVQ